MHELEHLFTAYHPKASTASIMCEFLLHVGGKQLPAFLMQQLTRLQEEPSQELAEKTLLILAPLANRLNAHGLKRDFEEIAFELLHPEEHALAVKLLQQREADTRKPLLKFIHELSVKLEQEGINGFEISGRTKQPYSLYKKLRKSGTIEDVHDLLAVRIIAVSEADCYRVLDVIHQEYHPKLARFKDYIKQPKSNGYQSLHSTLEIGKKTLEIQIRTPQMHEHAEGGMAAHWQYDEHKQTKGYLRGQAAVKEDRKAEKFVYVFSPDGDLYRLRRPASVLDFAFAVHTGVGLRTKSAQINGAIAPLDTLLANGDRIKITTGKQAAPKRDWLRLVHSRKAKSRIRTWLKAADRDRYLEVGRELLEEEFGDSLPKELSDLLPEYKLKTLEDLLVAVGAGYISPLALKRRLAPPIEVAASPEEGPRRRDVIIGGMRGLQYRFGQCCEPEPPQPISGFITRSLGITVHRVDCPELLAAKERRVACEWARRAG